jgi:TPP-dependent pyruvate/acetoin dehydrogenase alpha subunit
VDRWNFLIAWASENDPLDRYATVLTEREGLEPETLTALDTRVVEEIDRATDEAETSPPPEPLDALEGVYAEPRRMPVLWYREGVRSAVDRHERPASWGTHDG